MVALCVFLAGAVFGQVTPDELRHRVEELRKRIIDANEAGAEDRVLALQKEHDEAVRSLRELQEKLAALERKASKESKDAEGEETRRAEEIERLEVEVRELAAAAERAAKEGAAEKAEDFQRRAAQAKARLADALELAASKRKEPKKEKAPAKESKKESKKDPDKKRPSPEQLHAELRAIHQQLEEAEERRDEKRARSLRDHAAKLEALLREAPRRGEDLDDDRADEGEELIGRAADLRRQALRARRKGEVERAQDLWREAARIEHEVQRMLLGDFDRGGPPYGEAGRAPGLPSVPRPPGVVPPPRVRVPGREGDFEPREGRGRAEGGLPGMREEVQRLRAEVEELRVLLKRALGERKRSDDREEDD
jgi:chemotaxis protein histidine kinase CheA